MSLRSTFAPGRGPSSCTAPRGLGSGSADSSIRRSATKTRGAVPDRACRAATRTFAAACPVSRISGAQIDTVPPRLGPPPALTPPPMTERTLPNGLRLIVVEQHELPLADFVLVLNAGGEADPPN